MKRKPFWRRVNRGLFVSLAALLTVILYVTISYIVMAPDRKEIRTLTESYRTLSESTTMLSDADLTALKDEDALKAKRIELKKQLSELFVSDSGYLDSAVDTLMGNMQYQLQGIERITARTSAKDYDRRMTISEDVASYSLQYLYTVNGQTKNVTTDQMEDISNQEQMLYLSLIFKLENGAWKIYRVSNAAWSMTGGNSYVTR